MLVKTYVDGQGLLDTYKANDELMAKLDFWTSQLAITGDPRYQPMVDAYNKLLTDYAEFVKKGHNQAKGDMQSIISLLKDKVGHNEFFPRKKN